MLKKLLLKHLNNRLFVSAVSTCLCISRSLIEGLPEIKALGLHLLELFFKDPLLIQVGGLLDELLVLSDLTFSLGYRVEAFVVR